MELTKQPQTELEFWMAIEGLGGFRHSMEHGLAHDRIEDTGGGVAKDVVDAATLSRQLIEKVCERFGVFDARLVPDYDPKKPPSTPEGKEAYWDWYRRMKTLYYEQVYQEIICSACPFSEGMEKMRDLGIVPCRVVQGTIYNLLHPSECGMTMGESPWSRDELYRQVLQEAGADGLRAFVLKEMALKEPESVHAQ